MDDLVEAKVHELSRAGAVAIVDKDNVGRLEVSVDDHGFVLVHVLQPGAHMDHPCHHLRPLVQLLSRLHLHLLQDQVLHVLPLAALLGHEQVLQNLPVCCSSFDGPCPEIGCDGGVVELFQRPHLVDKVLDVLGVCDEVLVEQLQRQCLFFFRFSVQVLIFVYPPKLPSSQVAYERQSILRQTVVREICEEVLLHRREDVDAVAIFAALLGVAGRRFRAQRNRGSNHGPVLLTRNHGQFAGPLPVPFPPIGGRRRRGLNEGKGRYSKARGR
mmetsp:Transcript_27608/g.78088  ORF Transcript_27608/g.78088 Transcript_27608/m.78088 type:complete len:271 (-) Transcript_27608:238-1050(-)